MYRTCPDMNANHLKQKFGVQWKTLSKLKAQVAETDASELDELNARMAYRLSRATKRQSCTCQTRDRKPLQRQSNNLFSWVLQWPNGQMLFWRQQIYLFHSAVPRWSSVAKNPCNRVCGYGERWQIWWVIQWSYPTNLHQKPQEKPMAARKRQAVSGAEL